MNYFVPLFLVTTALPEIASEKYGNLPLYFEPGTAGQNILVAPASDRELRLGPTQVELRLGSSTLQMRWLHGNRNPSLEPRTPLEGKSNYFIGDDPSQWRRDVAHYKEAHYKDLYPGIDMAFHGTGSALEYDLIVSPHADLKPVEFKFSRASDLSLSKQGDLVLKVGKQTVVDQRPVVFQEIGGDKVLIAANFIKRGPNRIGFAVGSYDRTRTLIIDPVLHGDLVT